MAHSPAVIGAYDGISQAIATHGSFDALTKEAIALARAPSAGSTRNRTLLQKVPCSSNGAAPPPSASRYDNPVPSTCTCFRCARCSAIAGTSTFHGQLPAGNPWAVFSRASASGYRRSPEPARFVLDVDGGPFIVKGDQAGKLGRRLKGLLVAPRDVLTRVPAPLRDQYDAVPL
jgi:hypothetical protein